ncbi:cupin domain-containing protein [Tropicimonas sp. IMCC6043]|uniref:cupin domain-containing protein n=1 Tax=Tropicimonas sp. IMCC6043 TaxID=2510645 RepID=UPI00101C7A13|nr:cupin domain-containing protein [Tropicimonas sp. IMCC6043]RYH10413.1 cupin domain-containing protein [Tropicimonas sp. IMCC6043]
MFPAQIIALLGLKRHPEGGWYRETWVGPASGERPSGTCIFYLLDRNDRSHWHKVDATEIWHFYAGDPLILSISETESGPARDHLLGANLAASQSPQIIVPELHWQSARSAGDWSLVGCTVSPGFRFEGFTLAPPDFDIPRA